MSFLSFANPQWFQKMSRYAMPILIAIGTPFFLWGLYKVWFVIPNDYQQGETIKILFVHVPSAWMSMWIYMFIAVSALGTLVWKHPLADVSAKAGLGFGAAFAFITLVTGSLWGKPMWGTWWQWDARLTSMLILFLLYLGLIAVWNAIEDQQEAGRLSAILSLTGVFLIPFIILSVEYFDTLHQGKSVNPFGKTSLDDVYLYPLLSVTFGVMCLYGAIHMFEMRNELLRRRIKRLQILKTMKG